MFPMLHPELRRKGLALVLTLVLALTGSGMAGAQHDGEANPPAKPAGLEVSTEAGSLDASVLWKQVDGADSYWIRWRAHSPGNKLNEGVRVEASEAEVTVDGDGGEWMVQVVTVDAVGEWVMRVQACVGDVCGPPLAQAFTVEPAPEPEPVSEPVFEPASLQKDVQEPVQDPEPTPEPANRAPGIDEKAARYGSFTETGNAPRGTLVHRFFDGIFSDPDGDALTFTAEVTAGRAELVDAVHVAADRSLLFVRVDGDDDWAALSPVPANPLATTVTLTATDPGGLSASLTTTWHTAWDAPDPEPVSDPESEPAKALGEDSGPVGAQLGVSVTASAVELAVGEPVNLSAVIANAPDEGSPSYSWEMNFGGSWSAWGTNATFSYIGWGAESQSFRVTVSYGSGETATSDPLAVTWVEELPNRAPAVNENAAAYDAFVKAGSAPRGTLVTKSFAGIFTDPDGDALNYATALSGDGSQLAQAVQTSAERELVGLRMESVSDWGAVTPALPDPLVTTVTLLASDPDGLSSASVTGSWQTDWDSHPKIVTAEAHISDGSLLLVFNQDVQASPAPTAGQFTVNVVNADGTTGTNAVEGVSVLGNLVFLDLAEKPIEGQTITVDYAHADATPLKRAAGGGDNAPGFTGQAVEVVEGLVTAAQQQEATTLVSNTGQSGPVSHPVVGVLSSTNWRAAGSFTTGDHAMGYTLSAVDARIGAVGSSIRTTGSENVLRATVREIFSAVPSPTVLYTLTNPASLTANAMNTFTAPAAATLDANTTYALVFEIAGPTGNDQRFRTSLSLTGSHAEDAGAASGWSIGDLTYEGRAHQNTWANSNRNSPIIAIKGELVGAGPLPVRAVTSVDRAEVVITFNESLNTGSTPAPGDFTVTVNGARRNVNTGGVVVSGSTVTLTLASAVASTDVVMVSYAKPTANPLQGSDNDDADSFEARAVDITLVSNLGQADGSTGDTNADRAQGFTTGANPGGYKLTAVDIQFNTLAADQVLTVSIRSGASLNSDGTLVGTLTNPGTLAAGVNTFTAPGDGIALEPSTGYVVVVDFPGTGASTVQFTASDAEDTGAESGWDINDRSFFRNHDATSPGFPSTSQLSRKMAIVGYGVVDYDSDDDGLIEVRTAAQLNALRWDTDGDGTPAAANQTDYAAAFSRAVAGMGCPDTGCAGYEIGTGADMEAAVTINLGAAPYNTGEGWVPIPSFATVLEGNGHTIDGLFINRDEGNNGLFASISSGGRVQNLSLTGVSVTSNGGGRTGSLAGDNSGHVAAVSAAGAGIMATGSNSGGLVGFNNGTGTLVASHSHASVTGEGRFFLGGLVGQNEGRIVASYATGTVTGGASGGFVGGLVGGNTGSIVASYSTGQATGGFQVGGLVGHDRINAVSGTATDSYWDTATSGLTTSAGGTGKTTSELQTPTDYTGIYANWNLDLDGRLGADDPWSFGTATDYPTLDFVATLPASGLADYDTDDDGLIEVTSAAQLNALRWDADGNGAPDQASLTDYLAAYPNAPTGMGCPAAGCTGYEIGTGAAGEAAVTIDLDVAPYNAGAGWVPLPAYSATLEGNGNTIDGLTIVRSGAGNGLFASISAGGRVQNLLLTGVSVTSNGGGRTGSLAGNNSGWIAAVSAAGAVRGNLTGSTDFFGGLVGRNDTSGTIVASRSAVSVTITGTGTGNGRGGLAGSNNGRIAASYATGSVSGGAASITTGGLVGTNGSSGTIVASYSTGAVSSNSNLGGLVAFNFGTVTDSYWDTLTSGLTTGGAGAGKTPAELIAPTGYTDIYANWNADLNGDSVGDDPWDFGADDDYPVIDYGGLSAADQPQPPVRVIAVAVSSTVGGHDYYTEGEVIRIRVSFRKAVNVDTTVGRPRLKLKFKPADTTDHWAVYESGSGTRTLIFAYTVLAADSSGADSGVAVIADSLENDGGSSIDEAVGGSPILDLSHPGLAHDTSHKVDGSRDITPPTVSRAETKADGSEIIVTFNEALKGHANTLDFRYSVDGGAQRVPGGLTTVLATGTVTLLGVIPAIEHGQTVQVKYIRPTGANVLRDTSDNAIESFDFQAVENKVPYTTPPAFVGAALNQAGDKITITFNEALDDTSTPAPGDFTVTVNGVVRTGAVSGVAIDGPTVVLTLTPALAATDDVQVRYAKPGANQLQDRAVTGKNAVETFGNQPVAKAQPVVTAIELINTPADGQTFRLGEVIKVRVTFSEPVTATGQPQLTLFSDDGWMRVQARGVVRGPGPYTAMEFRRGVQAGDQAVDKLVFGTHAKHGGGISMVGGGALTSTSSGLAVSPSVDPVSFNYKADGGPAPRDAYEGYESYGPCRRDIALGPWQYNYHGSLGTKWGVGCEARYEGGRYSKYFTFTIDAETQVRLHAESSTAFPKLILRVGRSYGGEAIVTDEGFGSLHWARIDQKLPAGTYTLEATTPSGRSVSYFHLWAGIPRDLPGPDDPCVMEIDRGDTEPGMWKGICHSTETLGAYARYYRYTPSAPGLIELFLTSRGAAEELYLYEGDTLIKQNSSLNWKRNGVYAWIHYSGAKAGVTYTIEVTTNSPGETGNYLLALRGKNYWLWNDSDFKPEGAEVTPADCREYNGTPGIRSLYVGGTWGWPCHSVEEAGGYARYHTFTITGDRSRRVVIEMGSPHTWDAVLYLREGTKGSGNHIAFSDDDRGVRGMDAVLDLELEPGTYTIEAAIRVPGNGDGGRYGMNIHSYPIRD